MGALICLAVSLAFMSVFDTAREPEILPNNCNGQRPELSEVSDAMIYAYITDEEWRQQAHMCSIDCSCTCNAEHVRQENRLPPNPNIPPTQSKI